ncbi:DUF4124 domain-containing protein [Massilia sp. BSC265]|uniref:DUF4124 domain-containing protein n=1 Tax=Massilia sp. BSC265 TaxID=1549812 RepID=UPI0004E90A11|nr:DUF4124 domain-containing protein [Massilia sp. BSC265]KFI08302.1 hypothetical protein JN27_05750 [Massilia sp. BSC265]
MPRYSASLRLIAAFALVLGSSLAHAQYSWTDANGVRHFSDRPPPPATPPHKILEAPGRAAPPVQTAPVEPGPSVDAPAPAKGPKTLAQREEEYRARTKMREEQDRKDAAETQRRRDLAQHCRDAREMRAQMQSGVRIAKFDTKGERSFMTDEERAAQLARVDKALAQCR